MNRISILVSNPLNPNLTRGKLLPLVELPEIREIVAVQDAEGPPLPKVRYVTLGLPSLGTTLPKVGKVLHLFRRVAALCVQIARLRPSMVMGVYMMPHGLLAYTLGRLTRRRVCIHVIGGPREIIDGGYWLDQWPVRRPSKRLEQVYLAILRRADVVMVVGTQTKRYLVSQGVPTGRVHVMSSKIDAVRFRPAASPSDYDLILAAQLIARKRVDLFLRIVAELRQSYPKIRAAVLGEGPLRGELERLAMSLGLEHHVDFLGFREDTERYYTRAKVFVLTSSAEGLSLAMLEAMACGLPVVVPIVGDMADVVRDGITGHLVEGADHDGFVSVIRDLLEHDDRRHRLGENARAAILAGYTVEEGTRGWHTVLNTAFVSS